jgi:hypothetical protein
MMVKRIAGAKQKRDGIGRNHAPARIHVLSDSSRPAVKAASIRAVGQHMAGTRQPLPSDGAAGEDSRGRRTFWLFDGVPEKSRAAATIR